MPGIDAFEAWDARARKRVVVHRHRRDASARKEFARLEQTATCDPGLVAGAAFHRILNDEEIEFGDVRLLRPDHPNVVIQTHPGSLLRFPHASQTSRDDAEIAVIMRPVLESVLELHEKTDLVHLDISPASLATMPSGRCTLVDFHVAEPHGSVLDRSGFAHHTFSCPDITSLGVAHRGMDIWSCGILLLRLTWGNASSPKAAHLRGRLLHPDINKRPSAREALAHQLFAE
jgi:serine/threonine protein kinase